MTQVSSWTFLMNQETFQKLESAFSDMDILIDLEMVSDGRENTSKPSVKVSTRSDIRNTVETPPILQVSCWTWTFLMDLETGDLQ